VKTPPWVQIPPPPPFFFKGKKMKMKIKKGKLIVLEGLDKIGKTTQSKLLVKNLQKRVQNEVLYLPFPNYNEPITGELIYKILNGELKIEHSKRNKNQSHRKELITASLFSLNRFIMMDEILKHLDDDKIIILDRYYISNIVYQLSLLEISLNNNPNKEREKTYLKNKIMKLEFDVYNIIEPNLIIIMHPGNNLLLSNLKRNNKKDDDYDKNMQLQQLVDSKYWEFNDYNIFHIECLTSDMKRKSKNEIQNIIFNIVCQIFHF
jgi:thymidylate kinase